MSPSSSTFPFLCKAKEIGFSLSLKVSDDRLNGSVQFDLFKNIVEVLIQTETPG